MITTPRLTVTLSNHTAVANTIAACLIAFGAIVGVVALSQSTDLVTHNDDTAVTTTPQATAKTQVTPEASKLVVSTAPVRLSIAGPQPNVTADLQPAQNTVQNSQATAYNLQPNTNGIQVTAANFQNAEVVLQ